MTVNELIIELSQYDPDAKVVDTDYFDIADTSEEYIELTNEHLIRLLVV